MQRATFKLIEERSGVGDLIDHGVVLRQVRYHISRYQGMLEGSGMPVPGLHRIEGSVDFQLDDHQAGLVGAPLTLRLEDGRSLNITLSGRDGTLLGEGHGPTRCLCC